MKNIKLGIILTLLLLWSTIFLSGCSILDQIIEDEEVEVMDFHQRLELKKTPKPVKTNPTILFLGNSMTFYNDLPSMLSNLSFSGGFNPDIYEITEGSYRLEFFSDEKDEIGKQVYDALDNYEWDYVILQEQSGISTMMAEDSMFPAARVLDQMIKTAKGETVFLMTWAYKDGFSFDILGKEIKYSREEMQTKMVQNYMSIANELDAMLAPAGIAFMRCSSEFPEIELWDEDLNHPSPEGTYLAACVLYSGLFDSSPEGLTYTADIEAQTAAKLQTIAAETVGVSVN
ncbi:MAG: DUF4886 domain-containing protein [Clostridiales bacterium]|nr:DUF4886 domain-containing protein [Clostridiales bacterium]